LHEGLDFSTIVGQDIVAPLSSRVRNFKGDTKPYYPMVQIYPLKNLPTFDYLEILYVDKPKEVKEDVFRNVKAGEIIGTAANLQDWYSPSVGPHVHLQIWKGKDKIDPTPFFFKKE
jgi:murein DD-endopeptidase MepM/ murein hydrolase activator NlpD